MSVHYVLLLSYAVVGHHHHSPSPSPSPFLAAADDDEVSSGDEGLPDNSLTRTAIHRHLQSTYSELLQKSGGQCMGGWVSVLCVLECKWVCGGVSGCMGSESGCV